MPKTCRFIKYVQMNDCSKLLHFIGKFNSCLVGFSNSQWNKRHCPSLTGGLLHRNMGAWPRVTDPGHPQSCGASLCNRCPQLLLVWTGVQWKWCWKTWSTDMLLWLFPDLFLRSISYLDPSRRTGAQTYICLYVCMYACMYWFRCFVCMFACV